ncbi:hypothetical protein J6590_027105 [Homalodisca vitripennis]|nr:hypothetical protein J6590_027105 [Homalodisca vitripennis]
MEPVTDHNTAHAHVCSSLMRTHGTRQAIIGASRDSSIGLTLLAALLHKPYPGIAGNGSIRSQAAAAANNSAHSADRTAHVAGARGTQYILTPL